jgi:hypothetical protein
MAPKTLGESNLGRQHQSSEPSLEISATDRRSPMIPYDSMGL